MLLGHHLALQITPPPLTIVASGGTGLDLLSKYVGASHGSWIDGCGFGDDCSGAAITRDSRWMAMRYAMIRRVKARATIDPRKNPIEDNPADDNTKCLTSPAFVTTRNRLQGEPQPRDTGRIRMIPTTPGLT